MYLKKGRIYSWCALTPENGGALTTHCTLVRVIYSRLRCLTTVWWLYDSDSPIDKLPGYKIIRKSGRLRFRGIGRLINQKLFQRLILRLNTTSMIPGPERRRRVHRSFWFWRRNKFAKCVQTATNWTHSIVLSGVIKLYVNARATGLDNQWV